MGIANNYCLDKYLLLKKQKLSIFDEVDDIERKKVKSTLIKSLGYDEVALLLEVEFHTKEVSRFINVQKHTYEEMLKASSIGSYFIQNITNSYPNRFIREKKRKFTII